MKTILMIASLLPLTAMALQVGDWGRCVVLDVFRSDASFSASCLMKAESLGQKFTILDFVPNQCQECTATLERKKSFAAKFAHRSHLRQVLIESSGQDISMYARQILPASGFSIAVDSDGYAQYTYRVFGPTVFVLEKIKTGMYKIRLRHEGQWSEALSKSVGTIIEATETPRPVP